MPRKAALYLDTSVPSQLFHHPEWMREVTESFYSKVLPKFDVFISDLVLYEISRTTDPNLRTKIQIAVQDFSILTTTDEARSIATEYLRYLKIPERDVLHIAIASVEGMDYLVTWNMKDLANERTRRIVDNVNYLCGLSRIYIITPIDLLGGD